MRGVGANAVLGSMMLQPFDGFPSMTIPDENALRRLQSAREFAKSCKDPVEEVVSVRRGLPWNRRTVTVTKIKCGLSQPSPSAIPSELVEV